jgi:hypothetical protein
LGRDDRSAEATIHGDAGSEKQALRDELGKIEEAGERRGASRAEQIREQGDAVKRYAARNGAVTLERARIIGEGGEHVVEGAGDRVLKHTKGFGSVVDAAPGEKPDLKPATPMEYLRRTDAQNKLFGDDSQLEGASVSMDRQHVGLAASQRTLEGSASEEDVRKTMSAAGYRPVAASAFQTDHLAGKAWFHPESGVLVSDTKPQNFITGADGKTVPFDTIPQHFPEGHPLREHFLNHLE